MNIRTRVLLLVLAVWLPAVAGFGLLARSTYQREEGAARSEIRRVAQGLNLAIEHDLDKRAAIANTLAASEALATGRFEVFRAEALAAVPPAAGWVVLVTRERQVLNTRVPGAVDAPRPPPRPFATREAQVLFRTAGPVVKVPVLGVFVPQARTSSPLYNVAVAFEPAALQKVIEVQQLPPGLLASVIDDHQRVMARSRDAPQWVGRRASNPDLLDLAQKHAAGFVDSVTLDGVRSLTYITAPNRQGWSAVVAYPAAALERSARKLTLQAVAAAGLLLLIGLAIGFAASRSISRPMLLLRDAAEQVGRDRVPPRLQTGLTEADEIGAALHASAVSTHEAGLVLERRVAQAVREAQDAQAKLLEGQKHEAIGRLTGRIAHDFNNLLQTISMGLQVVQRSTAPGPHTRATEAAIRACAKAADLVRQMLTFGRSQPLRPRAIDLDDFVRNAIELTRRAVGPTIEFSAAVAPGTPPVHADATQLELALLNLVFNARDAMPQGGHIAIEARPAADAEIAPLPPGRYVCVQVCDDGHGMDADTLQRAFEPYFTTKAVGAGSGIGLAQVQSFARQSGGEARIASEAGRGTQVALFLPVSTEPVAAASGEGTATGTRRPLRVLMVEDDLLVSSVVVPALQAAGHRVALSHDADDAKRRLEAGEVFEVLFTDVVMPGSMNGLDLVRWAREARPSLATVVATGYSAEPIEDVSLLRKPYDIEALLAALDRAVRHAPGLVAGT